jgi:hypothetical protein
MGIERFAPLSITVLSVRRSLLSAAAAAAAVLAIVRDALFSSITDPVFS